MAAMERARGWLGDVFAHHHAEQLRINREVQRKKMNLEQKDLPYPGGISGNEVTIHHHHQQALAPPAVPQPPEKGQVVIVEVRQEDDTWIEVLRQLMPTK